jgi:hypothetical protein
MLEVIKTSRGFGLIKFSDRYGQHCSLQESSLATEGAIWLGVDNTGDNKKQGVIEINGKNHI